MFGALNPEGTHNTAYVLRGLEDKSEREQQDGKLDRWGYGGKKAQPREVLTGLEALSLKRRPKRSNEREIGCGGRVEGRHHAKDVSYTLPAAPNEILIFSQVHPLYWVIDESNAQESRERQLKLMARESGLWEAPGISHDRRSVID